MKVHAVMSIEGPSSVEGPQAPFRATQLVSRLVRNAKPARSMFNTSTKDCVHVSGGRKPHPYIFFTPVQGAL